MLPQRLLLLLPFLLSAAIAAPEAFEVGTNKKDQLPGGKEADGIVGDFILRNDKIEAVISGNLPLRRANMSTYYGAAGITPGCLYDLTLRGANNDQLTIFAPAAQQGPISWVMVKKDGTDGEAVIETFVSAASNSGVERRHEYRLRDGWQGVLITTTLRNTWDDPAPAATVDRWTSFKRAGTGLGITWADAIDPADKAGYAHAITDGTPALVNATKPITLEPFTELKWSRFVAVGTSSAEALGIVASQRGATGTVSGLLNDAHRAPVTTAQIAIRPAAGAGRAIGIAYPDAKGRFAFALPAGEYEAQIEDVGRGSVTKAFSVRAGETAALDAAMSVASAVEFDIRDAAGRSLPCKAQFHALGDTEWPHLGPENRAHGCIDQWHSETGKFRVPLAPGRYRVVVTRGIEYGHVAREITLTPGQAADFNATLPRLVDTAGWVSADYHNHSTPSGDNQTGTDDRVINLAAEHIEFAPTTEHNRLYDWAPHIERLGLAEFIQTVPGLELTGGGAHQNAFPFKPAPRTQDAGAPVWNRDPRITAITLRDWQGAEPDRWVQINHPDMEANFVDRDADGRADGGFQGLATLIDGIETQNYERSELLDGRPFRIGRDKLGKESVNYAREFIWLQMLNLGHRYSAMAVCDAHSVWGNGVGGWRMYFPSVTDEPAKIDWRENSRHAKAGHSILTTGPFLSVQTDGGAGPGDTVSARALKLRVKVQCTDWLDIDRVQVLVNGRAESTLNWTRASHPEWFGSSVVKFDRTLDVPLKEDAHVIVVALAEKSTLALGYGTSAQAKIRPFAYHNPIFVDVDGGGFKANGDTLGWPLPVQKISVDEAKRMLAERGHGK